MLKNKKWLLINQNEITDSPSPQKYLIFIAEYILSNCQQHFIEVLLGREESSKVAVFATFCLFKNSQKALFFKFVVQKAMVESIILPETSLNG